MPYHLLVQNKELSVTGLNKSIGLEIVRKLGAETKDDNSNAILYILGCTNEELVGRKAVEELKFKGMHAEYVKIDLEDVQCIESAVKYINDAHGYCNVFINNSAVCFNDPILYGKTAYTSFDKQANITVGTDFFGALYLMNC